MDDLTVGRVKRTTKGIAHAIEAGALDLFASAHRASDMNQIETLIRVELAKLGVPVTADIGDPMFLMGYIVGRLMARGASREQVMAFLANVIDDETNELPAEIAIPGLTLAEQLRYSRMMSAQVWEIFYALEEAPTACTCGAPLDAASTAACASDATDERWIIAGRTAMFVAEFQMLMFQA